jgi:hypothetical protein
MRAGMTSAKREKEEPDAMSVEPQQQEASEPKDPDESTFGLSIVDLEELRSEPRAPWLVKDLIRQQSSVLVHGKTGTYKTFLVLDLFASVVLGRAWLGHEVRRQGPVLYVAAEGAETMAERLDAWCAYTGLSIPPGQFQVMTTPPALHDPAQALKLLAWIETHQPVAVAIDTLSKSMGPGTDENSNSDLSVVLGVADKIKAMGVTVVLIHHPGHEHQKRPRGGSALEIGVDTSILVEWTRELFGKLTCAKQKRSKHFDPIGFRLEEQEVPGTGEDPETTLVVVGTSSQYSAAAMEAQAKADRREARRAEVVAYLSEHEKASEAVIAKEVEGLGSLSGEYRKKFFDAMERDGLIVSAGRERQSRLWRLATS